MRKEYDFSKACNGLKKQKANVFLRDSQIYLQLAHQFLKQKMKHKVPLFYFHIIRMRIVKIGRAHV